MVEKLENEVEDVKFRNLFKKRDFIPFIGAPIHLGQVDNSFPSPIKRVLKQSVYTGMVCGYQAPFYVGLFYLIDKMFNLKFF